MNFLISPFRRECKSPPFVLRAVCRSFPTWGVILKVASLLGSSPIDYNYPTELYLRISNVCFLYFFIYWCGLVVTPYAVKNCSFVQVYFTGVGRILVASEAFDLVLIGLYLNAERPEVVEVGVLVC